MSLNINGLKYIFVVVYSYFKIPSIKIGNVIYRNILILQRGI